MKVGSKSCLLSQKSGERVRASVDEAQGVADTRTPLSALMAAEDDEDDDGEISEAAWELARLVRTGSIQDAAALLQSRLDDVKRHARLVTVRAMIRYIWQGAAHPWDMMKHALAITRRYAEAMLKGISMTEVAALLGETRAAPSAREKKIHDELLIRWGLKGYKADGGLKSESASASYSKAQKGNNSRRKGQRRKLARKILGRA